MDKKNNEVIASIHVEFTGDLRDDEQEMAIALNGNELTLSAIFHELTKALLNNGVPRGLLVQIFDDVIKKYYN